jgi:branched-chain amino acid transport system ATP-binding protein
MSNPDLLLMDEPSEGLAPRLLQQLGDQLLELKRSGLTIFLVEQNLGLALKLADEVYVLDRGQIVYHGAPAALDANAGVKQRYLGVGAATEEAVGDAPLPESVSGEGEP